MTHVTTCGDLSHVRGCPFRWEGLCCHSSWYLLSRTLVIGFVTATSTIIQCLLLYVWRFPYHATMHISPQIYLIPVLGTGTSNSAPQCTGAPKYTLHPLHSPLIHNAMLSTMYWHSTMQCIAMLHNAMLFSELVDKSTEPTPQLIVKSNNSGRNCKYFAAAAAPHYQRSSQL